MDWNRRFEPIIADIEADAYKRGWDDAVRSIMEAAKHPPKPVQPSLPFAAPKKQPGEGEPVIDVVYAIVRHNPGERGADIVGRVSQKMPDRDRKLLDRTVRTALMRLKLRDKIFSEDGLWYPIELKPEEKEKAPLSGSAAL